MQTLLDTVEEESRKKGLDYKAKRQSRNNACLQIKIFISENKLKQRDQFKYLGTLIWKNERNNTETVSKIV